MYFKSKEEEVDMFSICLCWENTVFCFVPPPPISSLVPPHNPGEHYFRLAFSREMKYAVE